LSIESNGPHTNGYSLIRALISERPGLVDAEVDGQRFIDAVLEPHKCYYQPLEGLFGTPGLHGIAHITGGGLHENLGRILPAGVGVTIDRGSWPAAPVFTWLQKLGDVDADEMYRVFNMGIGLVLVASPYYAESIQQQIASCGLQSWLIGRVIEGESGVRWA
jgi:phosphoribosylformylglycinamidine cyclo-ligase